MRRFVALASIALALVAPARAVDLSNLTTLLQNSASPWVKVNLNAQSDAWPAVADRQGGGSPTTVTGAWSGFAWDSQRGQLMLFGGGHANYSGNEMYLWNGATQLWSRGSLPSQLTPVSTPNGIAYMPVDFAGPPSMHTYDGNTYLPAADRFLLHGGPAWNYAGGPVKANGAATGPYLFDPNRSDPTKVGGTTGSGVNPSVLGSEAWSNRDRPDLSQITIWSGTHGLTLTDNTVANTVIGGKDVIYRTGIAAGNQWLIATTINDVNNPALDTMQVLGSNGGQAIYGAAGLDPVRGWFVGPAQSGGGFAGYSTAGGNGINLVVSGPSFPEGPLSGIDFDPTRGNFLVWTGAGDVWRLSEPANGLLSGTWTLDKVTDGASFAAASKPDSANVSGVRGKWHYIPNLDAFAALEGNGGEVWLYRPDGWVNPVPEPGAWAMLLAGLACVGWMTARRARME